MDRVRSAKHLKWVRSLPCVITGQTEVHAHHLIGHGQGGMGTKSSDFLAFPLCPELHHELHHYGWKKWEDKYGSQWKFVSETLHSAMENNL